MKVILLRERKCPEPNRVVYTYIVPDNFSIPDEAIKIAEAEGFYVEMQPAWSFDDPEAFIDEIEFQFSYEGQDW